MTAMDQYQRQARKAAVYQQVDDPLVLALGLCAEAGELGGEILDGLRRNREPDRARLLDEACDVLASLALLTYAAGLTLSEVAAASLTKLEIRRRDRPRPE